MATIGNVKQKAKITAKDPVVTKAAPQPPVSTGATQAEVKVEETPDTVELDKQDFDRVAELAEQKRRAGLPYEVARDSAERQVREDKCAWFSKIRNALAPKTGATTTAKA